MKRKTIIARVGDTIEWTCPEDSGTARAGKTYRAEVAAVWEDQKEYGVHAEYGQDYIAFEDATTVVIKKSKTKPIKAARCIHMPAPPNTVIIFVSKHGNKYHAGFTIDSQDFTICERENKEEAQWFCNMLEIAFTSLTNHPYLKDAQTEVMKQAIKDIICTPKITIVNLETP